MRELDCEASILKEISPRIPLEGMMLKLKLQYFGYLIPKTNEALIPEKPELLEEPKTPQESAAEPSPASVAGKSLGWAAALRGPRRALVRKEDFQDTHTNSIQP